MIIRTFFLCVLVLLTYSQSDASPGLVLNDVGKLSPSVVRDALSPMFKALKDGDVNTIKQYLNGDELENYRTLLEKNANYPEFLRNYYKGADFQIEKVEKDGADIVIGVRVFFPDGQTGAFDLQLQKIKDVWLITSNPSRANEGSSVGIHSK